MKSLHLILFSLFGLGIVYSNSLMAQTQKLNISFSNLSSNSGKIMVLVQDENEKDASKLVLYIVNKSAKVDIYLPRGKYGVIAFHDLNGNEKLDTNFMGIPNEPYGFSNNARGFSTRSIYTKSGRLIASTSQEVLMRVWD